MGEQQMKHENFGSIIFPAGLIGNHVRWLLFIDDKFVNPFGPRNFESKLNFIQHNIYGDKRTWNTWLEVEWNYREKLNEQLTVAHQNWDWEYLPLQKELYLFCEDIKLPFNHYYHINIGLNNNTPEQQILLLKNWFNECKFIKTRINNFPNRKVMLTDQLFQPILPYEWYKEVIDFFGFSDNYQLAQRVHTMHYQARKKSAQDFYQYFTSDHFLNFLNETRIIGETISTQIEVKNE